MSAKSRAGRYLAATAIAGVLGVSPIAPTADAQQIITPDGSHRNCQTVRTCNFSRTAAVRGCLSSYTCRVCRTVREKCDIGGARYCQRMVCGWGG